MRAAVRPWLLASGSMAALAVACTEDPITGPDGPGTSAPTVEAVLDVAQLPFWRDTSLVGFALPVDAPFKVLSNRPELRSRLLGRFDVPDSLEVGEDTVEIEGFTSGSVAVRFDTARSEIPGHPLRLQLYALARDFVGAEATWEEAAAGQPWESPGGALDVLIAEGVLEEPGDSVSIEIPRADTLLELWRQTDGRPGFAILVAEPETRLRVTVVRLRLEAEIEPAENPVVQRGFALPLTFVFDPPQPEPGAVLRVGGVPAARAYLAFRPPESVEGISLRDATVNRAELRFHPLAMPSEPFRMDQQTSGRPVQLRGDPFEFGLKTPIGLPAPGALVFAPDSLAAGFPISVDVTGLIQEWADEASPEDPIRIGLRLEPDGQTFGYWELGSDDAPAGLRPELRIVFTPPAAFGTP